MNYVNRRGDVYYVFQGVTKTGKPKYDVSLKTKSDAGQQIDHRLSPPAEDVQAPLG